MGSSHFSRHPFNPRAYNMQLAQQPQSSHEVQQQQQQQLHWNAQAQQEQLRTNPRPAAITEPFWSYSHGAGPPGQCARNIPADAAALQLEGPRTLPRRRESTGPAAMEATSGLQATAAKWKSLTAVRDGPRATNEVIAADVLNTTILELERQLGI